MSAKRFFNKIRQGAKRFFNKDIGQNAQRFFSKGGEGEKIGNKILGGVDTALKVGGNIVNKIGQGAMALAPMLGPEMVGVSKVLSGVGKGSQQIGNVINKTQQAKANVIQAMKPAHLMPMQGPSNQPPMQGPSNQPPMQGPINFA